MTRDTKASDQIIIAEPGFIPKMVDIFCHGQNMHHGLFPDVFCKADDLEKIARHFKNYMKPRNPMRTRRNFALAWEVDDQITGYILYQLYSSSNVFFGNDRWMCFVDDIAIEPNFRGRGGASKLLGSVVKEVDALENCVFHAQVWRSNEASEALFKKFGFDDKAKNYYRISK